MEYSIVIMHPSPLITLLTEDLVGNCYCVSLISDHYFAGGKENCTSLIPDNYFARGFGRMLLLCIHNP